MEDNRTPVEPQVESISERPQPDASMETLLDEQGGLGLDFPAQGEIREGVIATIRENEILVSIGTKSEGVISGREYEQIPGEEKAAFYLGQKIPVFVLNLEDSNGNVVLSYMRAREEQDWLEVERLLQSNEACESKVIGYNKGGLIVPVGRLRGFVPASQVSALRRAASGGQNPEQRYAKMVGEPMTVCVIEMDRARRRLILSEKLALQETRESLKERLLDELQEGTVRAGRVTSLADFGAFINIDGADGLVHLSEISWDHLEHPNEVLKVGQEVKVKVISVDRERKRIGLSIRQLEEDPWVKKVERYREGQLVEGTITHLTKFGAFARIDQDVEGLIHVSELSEQRVNHPKEVVKEGDIVTLRIIKIEPDRHRVGLSLRKVDSPAYADLDWKMALADEVSKASEGAAEPAKEAPVAEEAAEPDAQAPVVEEATEPDMQAPLAEQPAETEAQIPNAEEGEEGATVAETTASIANVAE